MSRQLVALVCASLLLGCGGEAKKAKPTPKRDPKPAPAAAPTPDPAEAKQAPDEPDAPKWKTGAEATEAFEQWYARNADDFEGARAFLREVMEAFGGTNYAAAARMRLKEVEGDRERAAGDWYAAAETTARECIGTGDLVGALAALSDVPEKYRGTSFGAQAKDWPRHLQKRVLRELELCSSQGLAAVKDGDLPRAQTQLDAARRLGDSAREAFAPTIAAEIAKTATTVGDRVEAAITKLEKIRRWEAEARPMLREGSTVLIAGDATAAWEIAKRIRSIVGPPDPAETGIRREAEELWIAAATKASGFGDQYAPGVAQKTPEGARLHYTWDDASELTDWSDAKPAPRVANGRLVLPARALCLHKARFPHRVTVEAKAAPNAVLICLLGEIRVVIWVGRQVTISHGDDIVGSHDQARSPARLSNPATITIARTGADLSVSWDGEEVAVGTLDPAPADAKVQSLAFHGGPRGSQLTDLVVRGAPELEAAEEGAGETAETPVEPDTPELPAPPRSRQDLRPRPPGLSGWTAGGHGKWSTRNRVEVYFDGGRKRDRYATLIHETPAKYGFSEYEYVCEIRFVKNRNGSNGGLMFPIGDQHVIWCFDDAADTELVGVEGVSTRGMLPNASETWVPLKVKVRDGEATGYMGRNKSWEFVIAETECTTPRKLPGEGVGFASRGGGVTYRNPSIKFYK